MREKSKWVLLALAFVIFLVVLPLCINPSAEFKGTDDAGSEVVEEIEEGSFEPWFTPVLERAIGSELPGEIESLLFCVQTGIGVGVLAFGFGYLVARKKYSSQSEK